MTQHLHSACTKMIACLPGFLLGEGLEGLPAKANLLDFVRIFNCVGDGRVRHFCHDPRTGYPCCQSAEETCARGARGISVLTALLSSGSAEPNAGKWFSVPFGSIFGISEVSNLIAVQHPGCHMSHVFFHNVAMIHDLTKMSRSCV